MAGERGKGGAGELLPVGAAEIAARLGVKPQTVHMWRHREIMPEPRWTVSGQPAWEWREIEAWARRTGRLGLVAGLRAAHRAHARQMARGGGHPCAGVGGGIVYSVIRRGLSAHAEPSRTEEIVTRAMRRWATPQSVRDRANPVQPTPEVLDQALARYADHCATCHANDGSGDTAIGRGLYPRVPDMRTAATQMLTDGELFAIIEHGIE